MAATEKVKNVVLVGQGGVGKTMLAEAMLHLTGKTTRLGGQGGRGPSVSRAGSPASHAPRTRHPIARVTYVR